jgi:plastocyanin
MRRTLPLLLLVASAATNAPARAATHLVRLTGGRFNPATIEIAVGDTVEWLVQENGHTISASDYRFDYEPNRTLTAGETRAWTFTEDETFRYICRIHAPAMSGIITVGEGSPPPPPPPPISGESRRVPSIAWPTIDAALVDIPADSEIVLEPRTYPPFEVDVDELLVRRATGAETSATGPAVIGGAGIAKTGIRISGNDVTIRDLEVVEIADDAIVIDGDDVAIEFVAIQSGYVTAITGSGAARTRITGTAIAANPGATGIAIDDPDGLLVEDTTITSAKNGIRVRGGSGVVVRRSIITGTGTGIALRSSPGAPLIGAHVLDNEITQTVNPIEPLDTQLDPVTGAGIWIDATWSARIERNVLSRTLTYGIAVTGLAGPSLDARMLDNEVTDAGIAAEGWDGLGTACTNAVSVTEPPTLATTNPCAAGPRPGLPYPKIAIELLSHAIAGTAIRDQLP